MNIKQSYRVCNEVGEFTKVAEKYQNLLEDDVADIVQLQKQKKIEIEDKINSIFKMPFIAVNTYKNNNHRQVHKYVGEAYFKKALENIETKINFFYSNERDKQAVTVFVEVPKKKFEKFAQDTAEYRWFPNGSAMVFDDIIRKNGLSNNTQGIFGVDVAKLAKKIGWDNPKIYNFNDYVAVDVNADLKTERGPLVPLKDRIDNENLFKLFDSYEYKSANDLAADKNAVVIITRNRDWIYQADAIRYITAPGKYNKSAVDYFHDVFGEDKKVYEINYGDWKRVLKGSAHTKINTFVEYAQQQTEDFYKKKFDANRIIEVKGAQGFLSSRPVVEKLLQFYNENFKKLKFSLSDEGFARIEDFVADLRVLNSKNDGYEANQKFNKINFFAVLKGMAITDLGKTVINFDNSKYPWSGMISTYSYNVDCKAIFNIVATYTNII